ncbi:MAG TPA: adenylate/guanylate cyclase domain-containing protein, partial [Anaerolineales bacterium]|nr:adenylate/guanylate cyclase domain-containing protein [Anaerolineales bacterium]
MNCGTSLAAQKVDEGKASSSNLDRYIPRELQAKLESARTRGGMTGERRIITILFCDVKGSTAAAEKLDPEEWTEIINNAFEYMIRPIYKYEGLVPRLMGDAILAFFGAPIAHEDDPQRAALAALDIQSSIEPYSQEIREKHGIDFKVRVGINTGLVVVGEIGSDLRLEYTAIGDAINLAARMEQTAEPGTIQITEETHKLIAPFFEFESLGESQIKGKAAPVKTFRLMAVKKTPGQLRGVEGLSSPLVGREAELSVLETRLQQLAKGKGSFIAITGEAGLGKTSLIAEARHRSVKEAKVNWLEGHAVSYAQSISYFPWRQVIRQAIGAGENDTPSEVRGKLNYACECCKLPGGDTPFIEAMLAVESEKSLKEVSGYEGEALVARITEATRGYFCGMAREVPLVIVLDDLHWMDAASLNLFADMADLIQENPILFVGMTRPDQEAASWKFINDVHGQLSNGFHQIALEPLPRDKTETLLTNLLGIQELPREVHQAIMDKAEGNPFFVEEIIRSLIETKQIVRANSHWEIAAEIKDISLPNTLTGVLGARIDRLPDQTKHILQIASVIGRSFDQRVLNAMNDSKTDLEAHIQNLEQAGLIQAAQTRGEAGFIFRHALVQDAAYSSILLKTRRELHTRVGTILEEIYTDRLEEFASLLAHHFYAAKVPRSLKYDLLAGEKAAHLYANTEAATHFSRALDAAKQFGSDTAQMAQIFSQLGHAYELTGQHPQALSTYDAMLAFGREKKDKSIELNALMAKATIYSIFSQSHNPALSEQMLTQALAVSNEIGDRTVQARLNWNLMLTYLFSKRLAKAREHGELGLSIARESNNREQLAFLLNDLCRLYVCLGEFEKAYAVVHEARELWQALDNEPMFI